MYGNVVHCFFLEIYTKNNVGLRPKNDNDLQPKKISILWLVIWTDTISLGWRNTWHQPSVCRFIMLCLVNNEALAPSRYCSYQRFCCKNRENHLLYFDDNATMIMRSSDRMKPMSCYKIQAYICRCSILY